MILSACITLYVLVNLFLSDYMRDVDLKSTKEKWGEKETCQRFDADSNARVVWRLRKKYLRWNKKNLNRVLEMKPPCSPSMLMPNKDLPTDAFLILPQNDDNVDINMSGIESWNPWKFSGSKRISIVWGSSPQYY